jgi:hypothetical protein
LRAAAAILTLRHDEAPSTDMLTAQLDHDFSITAIGPAARELDSLVTQLK